MGMALLGFVVGTIGTLIGVGGGFMLIPILLYLFPSHDNVWISAHSMWVVSWNATSGSIAYLRSKRVHLRAALVFIVASLPGSVLGVWLAKMVERRTFELIFSLAMIVYAIYLLFKRGGAGGQSQMNAQSRLARQLYIKGALISMFVGFIASFFGLGGGVIHVPLLSHVLGFPVHMATGTSHLILAITAWFTTGIHLWTGELQLGDPMLWQLAGGAVVGAQVGARLSQKVSGKVILRFLAIALLLVGVRILLRG